MVAALHRVRRTLVEIIDAQIHCWAGRTNRHWQESYVSSRQDYDFPIELALGAMEAVGVTAAILDSPGRPKADGSVDWANSYAEEAALRYPGTIASTIKYDHRSADIKDLVSGTRERPGVLGIRVLITRDEAVAEIKAGSYDGLLAAAEQYNVPVALFVSQNLDIAVSIATSHPGLQIIIDHFGLPQPPMRKRDDPPFLRLPELLHLAQFPNVAVKFIGAPAYSMAPYPYPDIWPYLIRVIEAFRPERLMWGSDVTRFRGLFSYSELLDYLRYTDELSNTDKAMLLGGSLRRIFRWPKLDKEETQNPKQAKEEARERT